MAGSSHSHGSHSTHQHSPASTSDDPRRGHNAHDLGGADHGAGGHDKHAGHSVEMFRQKFWGTLLLSIPTIIWAPMIQHWFGYEAPAGPAASRWVPAVFGTLVFWYGGWVFIQGAVNEIRDRLPGMMTLISLAITVAFGFSLAVTFGFPGSDLWWELATLVTIMVLGHWIEMRSISQAQGTRETASGHGRSNRRRPHGDGPCLRTAPRRRRSGSSWGQHPRRRRRQG